MIRVVWVCHLYPPLGAAGAEWTAHSFLRHADRDATEAEVWHVGLPRGADYTYGGIRVTSREPTGHIDLVIGHLGNATKARRLAAVTGARFAWMAHAGNQWSWAGPSTGVDHWIANSEHVAASCPHGRPLILHPYPSPDRVGDGVPHGPDPVADYLLVNASQDKGGGLVQQLAEMTPDKQYLVVRGAYGRQIVRDTHNVTVMPMVTHIGDVYPQARTVLVPSVDESWSLVAVEAGLHGLPVVATDCPGIRESMGNGVIYPLDRRPDSWIRAMRQLDEPEHYQGRARASRWAAGHAQDRALLSIHHVIDMLGLR